MCLSYATGEKTSLHPWAFCGVSMRYWYVNVIRFKDHDFMYFVKSLPRALAIAQHTFTCCPKRSAHAKTCPDRRVPMVGMKVPLMFRKHVICKSVTYYIPCMQTKLENHQCEEKAWHLSSLSLMRVWWLHHIGTLQWPAPYAVYYSTHTKWGINF